jgi:hypothetical protein
MSLVRRASQLVWLFLIVSIAPLLTSTAGIAAGQPVEPPMGLTAVKPATPMPAFNIPGVDRSAFDSSELQGKVVVVRFWATW